MLWLRSRRWCHPSHIGAKMAAEDQAFTSLALDIKHMRRTWVATPLANISSLDDLTVPVLADAAREASGKGDHGSLPPERCLTSQAQSTRAALTARKCALAAHDLRDRKSVV